MKNIFVKKELLTIDFYWGEDKNGETVVSKTLVDGYEKHTVKFSRPNYKNNVDILSKIMKIDGDKVQIDPSLLRYERFCVLAKEWTFTDKNGKIPLNRENIDNLDPIIGNFIVNEISEMIE